MGETATGAAEPRFSGFIDDFVSGRLHGWAVDRDGPDFGACIVVFAGDVAVGACRADVSRPDLVALMPGEGRHGFDCALSDEVFDADGIEVYAVAGEAFDAVLRAVTAEHDGGLARPRGDLLRAFGDRCGKIEGANQDSPTLRDIRTGPGGGAPRGGTADAGLILVDVRDLLAYHRVHVRVSGIQRVLCGLIDALPAADEAADLHFCVLSERPGVVNLVDKALLGRFVATLLGTDAVRQDLDAQIRSIEGSVRPLRTRAADVFFIAGAFWVYDRLDRHLARMREQGTDVGLCVHDLIPLTHPHLVAAPTRRAFEAHAVQVLPQFDVLFTTSGHVADQVRSILSNEVGHAPPVRAVPLPHRALEAARPAPSRSAVGEPFVLCVGTIEVRKNHILLYRVWAALLRKHGRAAVPRLVLVGRWGWAVEEFRQALAATDDLDGTIVVLSDVSDAELADLYRRCLFTVFPSFAEGWGLPVGESLAAGKLCVASRATAIPEVGGDACAYFDPHDVLDAFAAIERPIVDRGWLAARERQIAASFRPRVWADTAAEMLRGLRAVRARPRPAAGERRGPAFGAADLVDVTAAARNDDGIPWRSRMAGAVLSAGWNPPGPDGATASARSSAIALATDMDPGTPVTVLLRLAGTRPGRPCRLRVAGGREAAHLAVAGRRPRWHAVEATVGSGGLLRLTISGSAGDLLASDGRGSGFALSALVICGDEASGGRAAAYGKILDWPGLAAAPGPEAGAAD